MNQLSCNGSFAQITSRVDAYFQALHEINSFSGEVLISHNGETVFNQHYGYKGAHPLKIGEKYAIGSISKTLTAVLTLKLTEAGKLSLHDPLCKFISDFPSGDSIRILDLLRHQAGIPRELTNEPQEQRSLEQVVELIKNEKLEFKPKTNFLYSNLGYTLLSYVIEKVTATSYENAILELFEKPLGAACFGLYNFSTRKQLIDNNIAPGLIYAQGQIREAPMELTNLWGDGGLYGTSRALMKFGNLLFTAEIISKDSLKKMLTLDDKSDYGLGIAVSKTLGKTSYSHSGAILGYRSYWARINDEYSVVVLSNLDNMPLVKVESDIPKILYNHEYELPQKITRKEIQVSDKTLRKYVGHYYLEIDKNQLFNINLAEQNLTLTDQNNSTSNLKPEAINRFFTDHQSEDSFTFLKNEGGEFYIEINIMGGMKLIARKA